MSRTQVVTLRIPVELKRRLEREAKYQGVSLNQLASYLLNIQLTQIEAISSLESRLSRKSLPKLKARVSRILDKVSRRRNIPDWDLKE